LGMGRLGHSHLSSPPPARAHDWHRVFSHGAFRGRAVCRRHLQATGPSVFPVVPSSACFGDVQFRWATQRLPIVGCHMRRRQFVGTPRLGTEVASYYIRLVGRASCTSALNLIAGFSPQDTCAQGSLPPTVLAIGGFIHGHHAPWANGWHGKLGHRASRACMSRVFCWSGKPGHGGDLRTMGCNAGRWLAQPLGAQSPFTSPRSLTVQTIFARGCG
jgi:hypothetical protein